MKKLIVFFAALISYTSLFAQDITGQWNGVLKIMGTQLRIVLHVSKSAEGYSTTMDSPDQNAFGIPVTSTIFDGKLFGFVAENLGASYKGELKDGAIKGKFSQRAMEFPLDFIREEVKVEKPKRPQEPKEPFSYISEDVSFTNKAAGINLAGTLTLPHKEGRYAAVILISGSGPQNRDEELLGHKPFLVLAHYLTGNGIAVLRFDDRGVGKSGGKFKNATTADFATDVESAISYLKTRKEINPKAIGLIGHSEGGIIAPMVASRNKDVAFVVMLAGPGLRGDKILLLQQQLIGKANGVPEKELQQSAEMNKAVFDMVLNTSDTAKLRNDIAKYLSSNTQPQDIPQGSTKEQFIDKQLTSIMDPWLQYFMKYDPVPALKKVKVPLLAVNGALDLQVPPKENIEAIKAALAKNKKLTTTIYPGLNHLFQEAKTGAPSEYAEIEQTFSPLVMEDIMKWIFANVKVW